MGVDEEGLAGPLEGESLGVPGDQLLQREDPVGDSIAVGEGVSVPVRLRFDMLSEERKPLSGTASFSTAWQTDDKDEGFVADIVERWRRQRR